MKLRELMNHAVPLGPMEFLMEASERESILCSSRCGSPSRASPGLFVVREQVRGAQILVSGIRSAQVESQSDMLQCPIVSG